MPLKLLIIMLLLLLLIVLAAAAACYDRVSRARLVCPRVITYATKGRILSKVSIPVVTRIVGSCPSPIG